MIILAAALAGAAVGAPPVIPPVLPAPTMVALGQSTLPPPVGPVLSGLHGEYIVGAPPLSMRVHVRIMAGNQQLLDDSFRVSVASGATFEENRSEAPDSACPSAGYYGSSARNSLAVSLSLRGPSSAEPMVNVNVSWQRPTKAVNCGGEGSRQVQLNQTVPLAPGQSITLQGDGGLAVTISR